jgi:hypothetical protein
MNKIKIYYELFIYSAKEYSFHNYVVEHLNIYTNLIQYINFIFFQFLFEFCITSKLEEIVSAFYLKIKNIYSGTINYLLL